MHETKEELDRLQQLLDRSMEGASAYTRSIFKDEHRLSARQLSTYYQGVKQAAVATINSKGEPRVSPLDSVFVHGKFSLSTDLNSLRARHLKKRSQLSLTHFASADPVIIAHGSAHFISQDHADFSNLDSEWVKEYGYSILNLSDSVTFIRLDARIMLAYAFHPEFFPGS